MRWEEMDLLKSNSFTSENRVNFSYMIFVLLDVHVTDVDSIRILYEIYLYRNDKEKEY